MMNQTTLLFVLLAMSQSLFAADPQTDPAKPVTLPDGTQVELLGVAQLSAQSTWWSASGAGIEAPCDPFEQDTPGWTHLAVLRITPSAGADVANRIMVTHQRGFMTTNPKRNRQYDSTLEMTAWKLSDGAKTADISVQIAAGDWKSDFVHTNPSGGLSTSNDKGTVAISPLTWSEKGFAQVTVGYKLKGDRQMRIVAFDDDGKEHIASGGSSAGNEDFSQTTTGFDIPPYQIKRVEVQTRGYLTTVRFANVPMFPDQTSAARVEVKQAPEEK
jgi:hypothetical protein